ncbi:MAG: hypothetical protein IKX86_01860 [Clostridia bacterium]|nr:hypothetical protein [Clostridia bacterium]
MKKRVLTAAALLAALLVVSACSGTDAPPASSGTTEEQIVPVTFVVSETEPYPVGLPETPEDVAALLYLLKIDAPAVKDNRSDLIELCYIGYCALPDPDRARIPDADLLPSLRDEAARMNVLKEYRDTRVDHSKLLFGAYNAKLGSEKQIDDLKACGMNLIWAAGGTKFHDYYASLGIGVIDWVVASGIPFRWDPNVTLEDYEKTIIEYKYDHEAVWGFYQNDEPSIHSLQMMKENANVYKKHFPDVAVIENLLPGTDDGKPGEWFGDVDYRTYLETFASSGLSDYLCYDRYLYDSPGTVVTALQNLEVAADVAGKYGLDLWLIAGVYDSTSGLSAEKIKLQAYTAMAYGVNCISYACWTADGWGTTVLNSKGNKNPVYDALKEAVLDAKTFSPIYVKYSRTGTAMMTGDGYFERTDFFPQSGIRKLSGEYTFDSLGSEKITSMKVSDKEFAVVGRFEKKTGRDGEAFLIYNCTDYSFKHTTEATVSFTVSDCVSLVTVYEKGVPRVLTPTDGVYTVSTLTDAVFVTLE